MITTVHVFNVINIVSQENIADKMTNNYAKTNLQ